MKTIELHYNVRVAQGHRFAKDVLRPWPEGASLGDVMSELTTELQSLGCQDITVTRAERQPDDPRNQCTGSRATPERTKNQ